VARTSVVALVCAALAACATPAPPPPPPPQPVVEQPTYSETGLASWYGPDHQGLLTASGYRFDQRKLIAAHRSLPFGTVVRVTNLENGHTVKVTVEDRGPHEPGRIIDLSTAAATVLRFKSKGVTQVKLERYASDQPAK
jgi:rare lipoprotein A